MSQSEEAWRSAEQAAEDARAYAEGIVETVREPLVVLDAGLRVRTANRSFYQTFRVAPAETEGRLLYDLGNGQWDIPRLRELLEEVLPRDSHFNDFEVDHAFEGIGRRTMLLNARRLYRRGGRTELILLAIEDVTERRRADAGPDVSETRYRRLFETAQDGILILDADPADPRRQPVPDGLLGYSQRSWWGRNSGRSACSGTSRRARPLPESCKRRATSATRTCRSRPRTAGASTWSSSATSTRWTAQRSSSATSATSPTASGPRRRCGRRTTSLERRVGERTAELARANEALTAEIAGHKQAEAARQELLRRLATAQEEERHRIARELHDQMGQHLTALSLGLKVLKDATPAASPAPASLQQLQELADLIGQEVHHLALELRPTALDDLGLHTALVNYVEEWSERSGSRWTSTAPAWTRSACRRRSRRPCTGSCRRG